MWNILNELIVRISVSSQKLTADFYSFRMNVTISEDPMKVNVKYNKHCGGAKSIIVKQPKAAKFKKGLMTKVMGASSRVIMIASLLLICLLDGGDAIRRGRNKDPNKERLEDEVGSFGTNSRDGHSGLSAKEQQHPLVLGQRSIDDQQRRLALGQLPNEEQLRRIKSGQEVWWPKYGNTFNEGSCSNIGTPMHGIPAYDTKTNCCNAWFPQQRSNKCVTYDGPSDA